MDIKLIKKSESPAGLDELITLSYSAASASDLSAFDRRRLLFSLYSMRCLFDNVDLLDPPAVLIQHGCSFLFPVSAHPDYALQADFFKRAKEASDAVLLPFDGILIDFLGQKRLKFDAGSRLFFRFAASGQIDATHGKYPTKYGLFEAVDILLNQRSCGDELKGLWFLFFPFLLGKATDSGEHLSSIRQSLHSPKVYSAALSNDFSHIVPADPAEAFACEPFLADWFSDFAKWKNTFKHNDNFDTFHESKIHVVPPFNFRNAAQAFDDCTHKNAANRHTNSFASSKALLQNPADFATNLSNNPDNIKLKRIPNNTPESCDENQTYDDLTKNPAKYFTDGFSLDEIEEMFEKNPCEEALLTLLAARANMPPQMQTPAKLKNTVELITRFLSTAKNKVALAYFLGLAFLGLYQIDSARRAFAICLQLSPEYKPALDILAKLDKQENSD